MKTTILLDPGIVLPGEISGDLAISFWGRLLDWTDDKRSLLGYRLWLTLADLYSREQLYAPKGLSQIVHRSVGDLLMRGSIEHRVQESALEIHPDYLGTGSHRQILVDDLAGAETTLAIVLGSHRDLWPAETESVSVMESPPRDLLLNFQPNLPSAEALFAARKAWFSGKKILIVGGQVEAQILSTLEVDFGIGTSMVNWLPSEHNKKASNLKAVVSGLPKGSIIICLVGKVGHDVSGQMAAHCKKRQHRLHEVRYASHVCEMLRDLYEKSDSVL